MMEPVFSSTRSQPEASVTIVSVMHMYIIMTIHTYTHTYVQTNVIAKFILARLFASLPTWQLHNLFS